MEKINKKGLAGTFAYAITTQALNMTSGIIAYIMLTYSELPQTRVALLLTIPAIVGTFFAFISGNLINRFGVKKVTLFVHITEFCSGMIYLFFGNKTSIFVLYGAAGLYGFTLGGYTVMLATLYKETIPDESRRAAIMGIGNSIGSLGSVVISTVGGMIAAIDNGAHWERAYYVYFAMLICIAIEAVTLPKKEETSAGKLSRIAANASNTSKNPDTSKSDPIPGKVFVISGHYLLNFLFLYAFSLNISQYIITTHSLGTSVQSGFCMSCLTIGGIAAGLGYGIYSRFLKKWTVPMMLVLSTTGLGLCVFCPNIYALYIASALIGFSMMGCSPYIMMEMNSITTARTYTKAMSVYSGFMNGGMMVAVYILAFLGRLFYNDPNTVDGKFMIAFVGSILVVIGSIPIYAFSKAQKRNS